MGDGLLFRVIRSFPRSAWECRLGRSAFHFWESLLGDGLLFRVMSVALRSPGGLQLPSLFGQAELFLGAHRFHAQADLGHFLQLPRTAL